MPSVTLLLVFVKNKSLFSEYHISCQGPSPESSVNTKTVMREENINFLLPVSVSTVKVPKFYVVRFHYGMNASYYLFDSDFN